MSKEQLSLPIDSSHRANGISKRASRQRRRVSLPLLQHDLNLPKTGFSERATAGVPQDREHCPTESERINGICPNVRCRWHLLAVSSENRAGRPGLSSVKRDASGHTVSQRGHVGSDRPPTTLNPQWLNLRTCRAVVEYDEHGVTAISILGDVHSTGSHGNGEATWAAMHCGEGEKLRVVAQDGSWATHAVYTHGAIKLESQPLVRDGELRPCAVLITRVRGVSTCALDEVERNGKMTNEQIGAAIGRHRTLVAREVKQALRKASEEAERQGVSAADFVRALMGMGDGHGE